MKAYPLELHPPPCIGSRTIFYTNAATSLFTNIRRRKRIHSSTTRQTGKIHVITSTCSLQKVIRTNCSCLSNDANNLGEEENGIEIRITKIGKRSRRIESTIQINATLSTIWDVLTDYEKLSDFIPGLALSRLLQKKANYARIFQIGQQNLALGLKFNAKAVLDCYEMDLQNLSSGQRRDIKFNMVEGDFEIFQGKWSIQQNDAKCYDASKALDLLEGQDFNTILSYVVEVEPKLWLPVRLVEGRLCNEIKTNLSCVRKEAQFRSKSF